MRSALKSRDATRRTVILTTGGALAVGATSGCLEALGAAASEPGTVDVAVGPAGDDGIEHVFDPGTEAPLEIEVGTTVRFVWESNVHNIVVDSQPDGAEWEGHEAVEDAGFVHEHTFDVAGEYGIVCEPHEAIGMRAKIQVS